MRGTLDPFRRTRKICRLNPIPSDTLQRFFKGALKIINLHSQSAKLFETRQSRIGQAIHDAQRFQKFIPAHVCAPVPAPLAARTNPENSRAGAMAVRAPGPKHSSGYKAEGAAT